MAKRQPDLHSTLMEILKEQTNTEICLADFASGRKVKNSPKRKWVQLQTRIRSIVLDVTIATEMRLRPQNQFFCFFVVFFRKKKFTLTHGDAGKSRRSRFPRFLEIGK